MDKKILNITEKSIILDTHYKLDKFEKPGLFCIKPKQYESDLNSLYSHEKTKKFVIINKINKLTTFMKLLLKKILNFLLLMKH